MNTEVNHPFFRTLYRTKMNENELNRLNRIAIKARHEMLRIFYSRSSKNPSEMTPEEIEREIRLDEEYEKWNKEAHDADREIYKLRNPPKPRKTKAKK